MRIVDRERDSPFVLVLVMFVLLVAGALDGGRSFVAVAVSVVVVSAAGCDVGAGPREMPIVFFRLAMASEAYVRDERGDSLVEGVRECEESGRRG